MCSQLAVTAKNRQNEWGPNIIPWLLPKTRNNLTPNQCENEQLLVMTSITALGDCVWGGTVIRAALDFTLHWITSTNCHLIVAGVVSFLLFHQETARKIFQMLIFLHKTFDYFDVNLQEKLLCTWGVPVSERWIYRWCMLYIRKKALKTKLGSVWHMFNWGKKGPYT